MFIRMCRFRMPTDQHISMFRHSHHGLSANTIVIVHVYVVWKLYRYLYPELVIIHSKHHFGENVAQLESVCQRIGRSRLQIPAVLRLDFMSFTTPVLSPEKYWGIVATIRRYKIFRVFQKYDFLKSVLRTLNSYSLMLPSLIDTNNMYLIQKELNTKISSIFWKLRASGMSLRDSCRYNFRIKE